MNKIIEKLFAVGVVPVVNIGELSTALPIARALTEGGIPCIEITFRTEHAAEAIRQISKEYPDMFIGAGTILTPEQADEAIACGATFIVSPGLNPTMVKHCLEKGYPVIPGCANPSDVEVAIELGLEAVKFFPAEAAGGLNMIKSMAGPYHKLKFMPTGGINEKNINDYLAFDKIICCGGSFIVTDAMVKASDYAGITAKCKSVMKELLGLQIVHLGINAKDEAEHEKIAAQLEKIVFSAPNTGNSSTFVGPFEVMKKPYLGDNGHVAISVRDIKRAVAYYKMLGVEFNNDTAKLKDGKLVAIYFAEEVAGYAIHLVQQS